MSAHPKDSPSALPSPDVSTTPASASSHEKHDDPLLSWWLGAAIVGADIGTSLFYSTGVIWPYVNYAAPLIILAVCVLMWFFKATYEEGCAASPFNGGAYIMVLQTVGKRMALVVGALTILSYLATAAVSALSGAYYIDSMDNVLNWPVANILMASIAPVVVFGLLNIVGIKEPAIIVFFIATFHFALFLYMDIKGLIMAFERHADFSIVFKTLPSISPANLLHGFAAAFLGITGFESAAQIVEQLKTPTWRTLKTIYLVVVVLVGITAPVSSYLCFLLLDEKQLHLYQNSLLSGLAYAEGGMPLLTILVIDAALTLFAAVNTAYVGCIGLCTTMAKQGNLPAFLLRRWADKVPLFQGYPYVVLCFMAVTTFMICTMPGKIEDLGQVYGMAFLAVMASFCAGVIMLRIRMPLKVERAPYKTKWVFKLGSVPLPLPPAIGLVTLLFAETVLVLSAESARTLGLQILTLILLIMCLYRMGVLEGRLRELPDLRLGLGKFSKDTELPADLPTYVLCTGGAKARNLATMLIRLLEREEPGPKEVIIFHSEENQARQGMMHELLQRVVSQQIAPSFRNQDIILSVKILPESLVDGLIHLKRAHPFNRVFIGTGTDPQQATQHALALESNLGLPVVNIGNVEVGTVAADASKSKPAG
ncbi:MAG: APC family permease [Candidatus Obscuribacterales bacterium]|nr:APC family permease [Candidatus Obscuribacterales bacterium]